MNTAIENYTASKLAEMWTENTGTHMLDSGGDTGRKWQRNAGMTASDFMAQGDIYLDDGIVNRNTFHLCLRALMFDADTERLTNRFRAWVDSMPNDWDSNYYYNSAGTVHEFITEVLDAERVEDYSLEISNSYNNETLLDDVIIYGFFKYQGVDYLALSKHNGADVRGGYSDFVFFELACEPIEFLLDMVTFDGYCKQCDEWERYETYQAENPTCRECDKPLTELGTF